MRGAGGDALTASLGYIYIKPIGKQEGMFDSDDLRRKYIGLKSYTEIFYYRNDF
jgi:hypothetical protein